MIPTYEHHSPSSLNQFAAQPALFVLERILGKKQAVGVPAHRGVAVEGGVVHGLDRGAMEKECIKVAQAKYDALTVMSADKRREQYRGDIPDMVTQALDELRPYGKPSDTQGFIEWKPDGLLLPIVGYFDFRWDNQGIIVDLKTTDKMPSNIKFGHARQVALYTGDNHEGRLTYVTPKKCQTLRLENVREHKRALWRIAASVEKFLSLSNDPEFFVSVTAPDLDSFYWKEPAMRQIAFETWGI